MNRIFLTAFVLIVVLTSFGYNNTEIQEKITTQPEIELLMNESSLENYDWQSKTYAQLMDDSKKQSAEIFGGQDFLDPKIAFGMSFVIPGTGEMYTKNYVKGAVFMALEAGLWVGYFILNSNGNTKRDEYEKYQHEHFDDNLYLEWYEHVTDSFSVEKGTEILPYIGDDRYNVDHNHDYYEMTGKYPWFYLGWDDVPTELHNPGLHPDLWDPTNGTGALADYLLDYHDESTVVNTYMDMRKEANDYFIWSKWVLGAAIFNHLASAFDAAWSAYNHNEDLNKGFSERISMEPAFAIHNPTGQIVPGAKIMVRLK